MFGFFKKLFNKINPVEVTVETERSLTFTLNKEATALIEKYAKKYGISHNDVMNEIISLGIHMEKLESSGGKIFTQEVGSNKRVHLSFMKHIVDRNQAMRIFNEAAHAIKTEEDSNGKENR